MSEQGLYVRRNLTPDSAAALAAWAKSQGFTNLVPEHEMHATIVYSREAVWLRPLGGNVAARSGGRAVGVLGDDGAIVLHIEAPDLEARWKEALDAGALWKYGDTYRPHVTFTYDASGVDLSKVEPYKGDLVFGPEIHEPITNGWAESKGFVRLDASAVSVMPTLDAMALDIPHTPGHPNKHPFKGVLTRIDRPSDRPPEGSKRPVILTRGAAEKALPTLLGMPIDIATNLSAHDKKRKIGTITAAAIEGDAIHIEGFLYAADFPDEVARVQSERSRLGFSYEMRDIYVKDVNAASWEITDCIFTGAAILYKDKAAYLTTSLAAQAKENTMDITELKELLKAQAETQEKTMKDALDAGFASVNKRIDAIEAAAAEEKKKADEAKVAAAAEEKAKADKAALELQAAAEKETNDKKVKEMEDKLAAQETQIKDLQAAAAKNAQPAERKSLTPHVTALLARSGVQIPSGDNAKLTVADLDKAFASANLEPVQRMELKNTLEKSGLLAV